MGEFIIIKGYKNFIKQCVKVARIHEIITNIRRDFQHKLSNEIIRDNQIIISEDLQISNMVKNRT